MKQVTVLGMGPGNPDLLTLEAHKAVENAELIIGAQRLLDALPIDNGVPRLAATRADGIVRHLQSQDMWQNACVVMSGDIGLFSGANTLFSALKMYKVHTIPGISSAQYFAGKLQQPWQNWRFVSAHGVACNIADEVKKGSPLFLVTGGSHSVGFLCKELCEAGFGQATVEVGERLSYQDEKISSGTAEDFAGREFDALSVMLVTSKLPSPVWQWENTGIPDDLFVRGNAPMTKQEVRAAALAKLRIKETDILYDVGAGTGSVAVEMALLAQMGSVYAIEYKPEAAELLGENAAKFGLCNLHIVRGRAPKALQGLPRPQAVFIGGSSGNLADILAFVRDLNPSVRICVACITLETLAEATRKLSAKKYLGYDVAQICVNRVQQVGGYSMVKGQNPVFLVSAQGAGV